MNATKLPVETYLGNRAYIKTAVSHNMPMLLKTTALKLNVAFEEFDVVQDAEPKGFARLFEIQKELVTYQPKGKKSNVLVYESVVADSIEAYKHKHEVVPGATQVALTIRT